MKQKTAYLATTLVSSKMLKPKLKPIPCVSDLIPLPIDKVSTINHHLLFAILSCIQCELRYILYKMLVVFVFFFFISLLCDDFVSEFHVFIYGCFICVFLHLFPSPSDFLVPHSTSVREESEAFIFISA